MPTLFHPSVWPAVQLAGCLVAAFQLLMYRRGTSRHRPGIAWLAWCLSAACLMTAVKLICGVQPPPEPAEAMLSAAAAIVLSWHRGNLAHALRDLVRAIRAISRRVGL